MSDTIRVLVTGSRYYGNLDRVHEAVTDVDHAYPFPSLLLVHGRCDPRLRDAFRTRVSWDEAEEWPLAERLELLGGDWLMAQVAAEHGWGTESHAADWPRGKRAGFERNALMVGLGAELVVALTEFCGKPDCTRKKGAHLSHGTAHCMQLADLAGIKVWKYPAAPAVTANPVSNDRLF